MSSPSWQLHLACPHIIVHTLHVLTQRMVHSMHVLHRTLKGWFNTNDDRGYKRPPEDCGAVAHLWCKHVAARQGVTLSAFVLASRQLVVVEFQYIYM